ncbi:DUF3015 family protein [Roseateles sp.]|uniref:DUF3015 family protein n=1 Tax=Roseateles sp. TaxID=1971397 RepID=UPI003D14BED4
MMKKVLAATAAALLGLSAGAVQAREFSDIYTECGLGAMIAPNNSAVAAITNVTWDLGTTAISSNVSSADSCSGGKKKVAALLLNSYAQVETDLAKGEGEHLAALNVAAGCSAASQQAFSGNLRREFASLVAQPAYAAQGRMEKASALFDAAASSARNASCAI